MGNVAIQISWKVQDIFTPAISFPFFIPFLAFSLTPIFVIPFTIGVTICLEKTQAKMVTSNKQLLCA